MSAALQAIEIDPCNPRDLVRSQREYVSGLCGQFDSFEAGARKMSPIVCEFYEGDTASDKTKSDCLDLECELCLAHLKFPPICVHTCN